MRQQALSLRDALLPARPKRSGARWEVSFPLPRSKSRVRGSVTPNDVGVGTLWKRGGQIGETSGTANV